MRKTNKLKHLLKIRKPYSSVEADIVVIGGGITGVGIARDAAMRGFSVILIEKSEIGSGTSGNFHGVLWSGSRYAVNDPVTAAACMRENEIICNIAPTAVSKSGGLFVALNEAEEEYAEKVMKACKNAGIPAKDLPMSVVFQQVPRLNRLARRAVHVPDHYVNGVELLRLNMRSALRARPKVRFLTHAKVVDFEHEGDRISGVIIQREGSSKRYMMNCKFVVNAAGIWAGRVGALAGVPIELVADKGTMVVLEEQLANMQLHRCRPESDGDILVPSGKYSIMGTTSGVTKDIDTPAPSQAEIRQLLEAGDMLVPGLSNVKVKTAYAGVRPLLRPSGYALGGSNSRSIKRSFQVMDHAQEGISNFISIVGGKVTLYRLMSEQVMDKVCEKQQLLRPCHTASEALVPDTVSHQIDRIAL